MKKISSLSEESIINKIYVIRGLKVMIDRDLAELYGVETRVLNQSVRRHSKRFPEDFMFQMTEKELTDWKSQIEISKSDKMGLRKAPLVFTEQGVAMLSSVLSSDRAISVNIQIIRAFSRMRQMLASHKEIIRKLEYLEMKDLEQDEKISIIFEYLRQLEQSREDEAQFKARKRIGFRNDT
jgi:phage regulator Rha-like protein